MLKLTLTLSLGPLACSRAVLLKLLVRGTVPTLKNHGEPHGVQFMWTTSTKLLCWK